jgi:hypothetical protein
MSVTERYGRGSWAAGGRRSSIVDGGGGKGVVDDDSCDQVAQTANRGSSCSYWDTWRIVVENMRE